jgi:hypothetical protein
MYNNNCCKNICRFFKKKQQVLETLFSFQISIFYEPKLEQLTALQKLVDETTNNELQNILSCGKHRDLSVGFDFNLI